MLFSVPILVFCSVKFVLPFWYRGALPKIIAYIFIK
jgi:hypothetical protein